MITNEDAYQEYEKSYQEFKTEMGIETFRNLIKNTLTVMSILYQLELYKLLYKCLERDDTNSIIEALDNLVLGLSKIKTSKQ